MSLELFTWLQITLMRKFITSPLLQQNVNGVRIYFWLQHFGENQTTAILRSKWPCVLSPTTPAAMTLMIFMIDVSFFTVHTVTFFFTNEQLICLKEMPLCDRKTNRNLHRGMSATFHENKKEPSTLLWPKTVKGFQNMLVLTLLESL